MNGLPGMRGVKVVPGAAAAALLLAYLGLTPALADTIEPALVRAYQNNPQLNAQRAQVRYTDENVPQALPGARPGPCRGRKRPAAAAGLSSARRGHRQRRLPVHRYEHHGGRHSDPDRQDRY